MAKSVDDLIHCLLEDIAISGLQGLTINDIAERVQTFYNGSTGSTSIVAPVESLQQPLVTVDRDLLFHVWKWLARHPDVFIGDGNEHDGQSSSEIATQFSSYLDPAFLPGTQGEEQRETSSVDENLRTPSVARTREKPKNSYSNSSPTLKVAVERAYRAICGHAPDNSKVSALEFELLSHIAAARSAGILQGDLVRLSHQDKRSVPKRTDELHRKGYILKEVAYHHGTKTSRLTLRKFAESESGIPGRANDHRTDTEHQPYVRDVVRRVFDELSRGDLIPLDSLAKSLDMSSVSKLSAFTKIVRRLERLKLVKRVRTAFGPSASIGDLELCVQRLRDPTSEDMEMFDTDVLSLNQPILDISANTDDDPVSPRAADTELSSGSDSQPPLFGIPAWNPDRLMPNLLIDAIQHSGDKGLTNFSARLNVTGFFVRRSIEALLNRVSCRSLQQQPLQLRHLAIARCNIVVDGVAQYFHFSLNSFGKLVKENKVDISQVPGATEVFNTNEGALPESNGSSEDQLNMDVDEFGFHQPGPIKRKSVRVEGSFLDIFNRLSPIDILPRRGELVLIEEDVGQPRLKVRELVHQTQTSRRPQTRRVNPKDGSIGRPRKYLRGTEKFWKRIFLQARAEANPEVKVREAGVMSDPVSLRMYAERPKGFDEILVQALEAHLPVPATFNDIHEAWMQSIEDIFNRVSPTVCISPRGLRGGSAKYVSQVVIICSNRLREVDFCDRHRVHSFRFISSSASHSLHYRRYYPGFRPNKRSRQTDDARTPERRKAGPQKGVFFERLPKGSPFASSAVEDESLNLLKNYNETTDEEQGMIDHTRTPDRHIGSPTPTKSTPVLEKSSRRQRKSHNVRKSPKTTQTDLRTLHLHSSTQALSDVSASEVGQIPPTDPDQTTTEVLPPSHGDELSASSINLATDAPDSLSKSLQGSLLFSNAPFTRMTGPQDTVTLPQESRYRHPSHLETEFVETHRGLEADEIPEPSKTPVQHMLRTSSDKNPNVHNQHKSISAIHAPENNHIPWKSPGAVLEILNTTKTSPSKEDEEGFTPVSEQSNHELDDPAPQKRQKKESKGPRKTLTALCGEIVLQLVSLAGGAVPNDGFTIRRTAVPRWQEAGAGDGPQLKAVKSAVKNLCTSGKVKQVAFSFRGRGGVMVKRSVLYLPTLESSDIVEHVKKHILEAEPADYIPPEWAVEASRRPLFAKDAQVQFSNVDNSPPPTRRRASHSTDSEGDRTRPRPQRRGKISGEPIPGTSSEPTSKHVTLAETLSTGFVTLKVPGLGTLPAVELYQWRTGLFKSSEIALTTSHAKSLRGAGNRVTRRSIVWINNQDFPRSLLDLFSQCPLVDELESPDYDDQDWRRFAREIESVAAWEQAEVTAAQHLRIKYAFLNHTVPSALYPRHPSFKNIRFAEISQFQEDGQYFTIPFPPTESLPLFVSALANTDDESSALIALRAVEQTEPGSPNLEGDIIQPQKSRNKRKTRAEDDSYLPEPKRLKARTKPSVRVSNDLITSSARTLTNKIGRGIQYLRSMSEDQVYRLAVSVVVIRTLAGGIESFIDWPMVLALYPDATEDFIKGSWRTISKKYSKDLITLVANLQPRYLEALDQGHVPSINFADLKATDWSGIIDWVLRSVDRFAARSAEELPPSRSDLLEANEISFAEPKRYSQVLSYNTAVTGPIKEGIVRSIVFGAPLKDYAADDHLILQNQSSFIVGTADADVRLAKSWALATVLTPEESYDPSIAQEKLKTLASTTTACDHLLTRALKVLQEEKLVQQKLKNHKFDLNNGLRGYEVARNLFERFEERRMITAPMLRQAAWYKYNVLDAAFVTNSVVRLEKGAIVNDGEMVAVLNLLANGSVKTKAGDDVPRTRYGLEWERVGYETRRMDKSCLDFSVHVAHTASYKSGDYCFEARKRAIPRGEADQPRGRIPPWIDINGVIQPLLWEMFIVGILGCISQLPGSTAKELSRLVGYALEEDEVDLLMSWCVEAGFAKYDKKSTGYETSEDWWLCISTGVENGWEWNSPGLRSDHLTV